MLVQHASLAWSSLERVDGIPRHCVDGACCGDRATIRWLRWRYKRATRGLKSTPTLRFLTALTSVTTLRYLLIDAA